MGWDKYLEAFFGRFLCWNPSAFSSFEFCGIDIYKRDSFGSVQRYPWFLDFAGNHVLFVLCGIIIWGVPLYI